MNFSALHPQPTVLFDLDGTLLPMEMETFMEAYFRSLCAWFPGYPPDDLVRWVWDGTRAMAVNDGSRTNREAFAAAFTAASGIDYWENEPSFLAYYREGFQACARVCPITDRSRRLVEALQGKGYLVAVATNPLFPRIATESRLRWLGLDPASFPLVTTYENSRFCKPNPAYYREVCRTLGQRPERCLMVGNDVREDLAARQVGMDAAVVTDHLIARDGLPADVPAGSLAELLAWAEARPPAAPCPAEDLLHHGVEQLVPGGFGAGVVEPQGVDGVRKRHHEGGRQRRAAAGGHRGEAAASGVCHAVDHRRQPQGGGSARDGRRVGAVRHAVPAAWQVHGGPRRPVPAGHVLGEAQRRAGGDVLGRSAVVADGTVPAAAGVLAAAGTLAAAGALAAAGTLAAGRLAGTAAGGLRGDVGGHVAVHRDGVGDGLEPVADGAAGAAEIAGLIHEDSSFLASFYGAKRGNVTGKTPLQRQKNVLL